MVNQRVNMDLNRDLWKQAGIKAIEEGITKRELVEIALNDYIKENKEEMKMIYNEITKNFKANGEEERYVSVYNNADEIIEQFGDIERFEELFEGDKLKLSKVSDLQFPIITFDAVDSGLVFDSTQTKEDIMYEASEYFDKK